MKRFFCLYIAFIFIIISTKSQEVPSQTHIALLKKKNTESLNEKIRLDFAVPDIPAFKAIGADPSTLLRPSSAKDFALMFGNFINGNGNGVIPQNFSAEIAPGLIIKPWYTLSDYQKKSGIRFITKSRFSIATNKDSKSGATSMGIGFRTTLLDKGDFRLDKKLTATIFNRQDSLTQNLIEIRNKSIRSANITGQDYAQLSKEAKAKLYDTVLINQFDQDVNEEIRKYKKNNWNATKLDFAYSLLLNSPDSLIGNVKLNKHLFWLTWAIKPGKNNNWGQILLGFHNNIYNYNSKAYNSFTGNLRFYFGTNKLKGFLEGQYKNNNSPTELRLETLYSSLGLEVSLLNGVWIHFGTGLENGLNGNTKSQLVSNINLSLTFPENFKLF